MTFPNMPDASLGADETHEAQLRELCAGLSDAQLAELGDLAEAMHAEAEGRSRFSALSAKLAAHGAHNPDALAAYIGRKKYTRAGFAALAKAGRKAHGGNKIRSVTVMEWATRDFEWESRSAGDGRTLEGYAAVFGSPTRIADRGGDFDEVIRPGAFAKSLERRKPVLQFDHGRDPRIGSAPIGAIQDLAEDDHGLYVRARLFDHPDIDRVRMAIEAQAIRGMSFRFRVPDGGDKWTSRQGDVDLREIHDADTAELGPVVFPAYDDTSVSVRSMLERLDADQYTELIRALAAELRRVPDLADFTVGTDAGRAVDGEPGTGPGIGRVVPAVRTSDARHAHAVARFLQGRKIRA